MKSSGLWVNVAFGNLKRKTNWTKEGKKNKFSLEILLIIWLTYLKCFVNYMSFVVKEYNKMSQFIDCQLNINKTNLNIYNMY